MMTMPIGKRMQFIDETIKTRDEAKIWVDQAIAAVRRSMLHNPTLTLSTLLRRLLTARFQLAANVNPKLVLDCVVLS